MNAIHLWVLLAPGTQAIPQPLALCVVRGATKFLELNQSEKTFAPTDLLQRPNQLRVTDRFPKRMGQPKGLTSLAIL
eukprot:8255565-Pyramimonas_sp.AAC.1